MGKSKKVNSEIEAAVRAHVERLLGGPAVMELKIQRSTGGKDILWFTWECNGWRGSLALERLEAHELTARELGGLLAYLQSEPTQ